MLTILKEYIATWALMRLEKQMIKWNKKLQRAHARYYEKTGQWTPQETEMEDFPDYDFEDKQ